ncbi:hypothetical protein Tco_1247807, partial [Tanacetum coccineum]
MSLIEKEDEEVEEHNKVIDIKVVEQNEVLGDEEVEGEKEVDENEKTIEDLVDNHEYNDALLKTRLGKIDRKVYESLPIGPLYDAILKKKLVKKQERCGNFVIACSI